MTDNTDPDDLALAKLAHANSHGPLDSNASRAYFVHAVRLVAESTCAHCDVLAEPVPVAHQRWAVEEHHEHHCPHHDDNIDAVVRTATWE